MHLHCLIDILIAPYYYIYNDSFSVIYWTEWCNSEITQLLFLWIAGLMPNFSENFTNYFYELQISENICEIIHKSFTNFRANNKLFTNFSGTHRLLHALVGPAAGLTEREGKRASVCRFQRWGPPPCAAAAACLLLHACAGRWTLCSASPVTRPPEQPVVGR
jgi:hypothetical protein